jgi:hypothetical protein
METEKMPLSLRGFGITSLVLGFLGVAFCWWTPMGMILSLSGLTAGFVGWTFIGRKSAGFGLLVGGLLLSLVGLVLDSAVAELGLELVKFQALR